MLFCESMGHYTNVAQMSGKWDHAEGGFQTRGGEQWFRIRLATGHQLLKVVSPDPANQIVIGWAMWPDGPGIVGFGDFLEFRDGSSIMLECWYFGGVIQVRRGGTVLIQSGASVPAGTRSYVELRIVFANIGGSVELRINGVPVGSFEGDTINNGSTLNSIRFEDATADYNVRDIYIADYGPFLGPGRVVTILPNGNGATNEWAASESAENWEMVAKQTPDDDTYLSDDTGTARELYAMEDPGIDPASVIRFVQVAARAAKPQDGPRTLKMLARGQLGTLVESDPVGPSESFSYRVESFPENPDTGTAWTPETLVGAQFGFE